MTNSHKNKRRRRRWILIIVGAVALVGATLGLTAALRPNHLIDPSKLAKVEVKSKASGIVKRILVDYGDRVQQRQVLVELDKEQLQARVDEARANLQAAQAAVESAEATYERNVVDAQGPDLPFLKATAERDRKLAAEGLMAASEAGS